MGRKVREKGSAREVTRVVVNKVSNRRFLSKSKPSSNCKNSRQNCKKTRLMKQFYMFTTHFFEFSS